MKQLELILEKVAMYNTARKSITSIYFINKHTGMDTAEKI